MNRESILRATLWVAALFNIGGAFLFAFPESFISQFVGLPGVVPIIYRAFVAFFVLLFAGAYIWLAIHRPIVKPFVAFAAIGKACAFALTVILWLAGQGPWRGILAASGDLILAAIFTWCIVGVQQAAQAGRAIDSRTS
jgi:hypothetical protein